MNKIVSISVKHNDIAALETIAKLKEHCHATGKSFSHVVCKAIVSSEEVKKCIQKQKN